ncbi:alpha/beta hydrolase [Stratiformator vulcanicus]|uniref:Short chain dehydrogenase n=1 Tax=Stratiformator vulcanicus TaxID=2527980 RepID=A0A517R487_9PLAN|nr:alpha/beta hydrolase [Stratiformator vulcanicus]QDT38704.1 short chain dehydrogenase [Stratiformator vulcanicus]
MPGRYQIGTGVACSVAFALCVTAVSPAIAQDDDKKVITTSVQTDDGWTLPITYYRSGAGKESPAVVLVHGKDGNRVLWKPLAEHLHDNGYAVVAVDLRKHGESQSAQNQRGGQRLTPFDYRAMAAQDLEAVKEFLMEEHHAERLNVRKTGIVCADTMCAVGVTFALRDWYKKPYPDAPTFETRTPRGRDVRAIVMLSPSEGAPGMPMNNAVRELSVPAFGVSFFILVGEKDREDKNAADRAFKKVTGWPEYQNVPESKMNSFLREFPGVGQRGTDLFQPQVARSTKIVERITGFFDQKLRDLNDPWVDRHSRLSR